MLQGQCGRFMQRRNPAVSALPRGVVGLRLIYLFLLFFFQGWGCGLEVGGRGREPRKLLPWRSPGLCSRSRAGAAVSLPRPLPADSGRLPLRPGPGGGSGWGVAAALPQPRGEGCLSQGCSPPLSVGCRQPLPRGPVALPAASRRLGSADRRVGTEHGGTGPVGEAQRAGSIAGRPSSSPSARALPLPLLQPLSSLRPRESRAKRRKRESFSKGGNNRAGRHKGLTVQPALPEGLRAAPRLAGRPGGGRQRGAFAPLMLRWGGMLRGGKRMMPRGKDAEEGRDFTLHTYTPRPPSMHGQGRRSAESKVR